VPRANEQNKANC